MNYSHLEQRLKDLNRHKSEINTDELWKDIESRVSPQASRRSVFIILIFFFIITSAVGFALVSTILFNVHEYDFIRTLSNFDNINDNQQTSNNEGQIAFNLVDVKESQNPEIIAPLLDNQLLLSESSGRQDIIEPDNNTINSYSELEIVGRVNFHESKNIESHQKSKFDLADETSKYNMVSVNINSQAKYSEASPSGKLININYLNTIGLSAINIPSTTPLELVPKFSCPVIVPKSKLIQLSFRPYFEYDLPSRRFASSKGETNLTELREMTESNYVAYSQGLELKIKVPIGFNIYTGINQSVLKDKFDYTVEKDENILIKDIIKNISINANQDSVITIGDTIVNSKVIETGRKYNQYKSLDIPIGIGYSTRRANLEFGISVTALINLNFQTSGSIADENEVFTSIIGKYKDNIATRFNFSIPVQYYIVENIHLGIAPSFTFSPKSISSSINPLEHHVNLFKMRLFAEYVF